MRRASTASLASCGQRTAVRQCRPTRDLEAEDIEQALRYAAEAVRERELPIAAG